MLFTVEFRKSVNLTVQNLLIYGRKTRSRQIALYTQSFCTVRIQKTLINTVINKLQLWDVVYNLIKEYLKEKQ